MTARKATTLSGVSEGNNLKSLGSAAPDRAGAPTTLVRQHDLAVALGVTDKRVATWRTRSAVNGFPTPIACHFGPVKGGGRRGAYLWDLEAVQAWFATYDERAQRARGGWRQKGRTRPKLAPAPPTAPTPVGTTTKRHDEVMARARKVRAR